MRTFLLAASLRLIVDKSSLTSMKSRITSAWIISLNVVLKAVRMIGCISSMKPIESTKMNDRVLEPSCTVIRLAEVDKVVKGPNPMILFSLLNLLKKVVFPLCVYPARATTRKP